MPARSVVLERLGEVERRGARRRHAGGVHPAHRPRGSPRHRHRGPRRRGLAPGHRPVRRSRASPRPAPTRCGRASARRTTWPSTSSRQFGADARAHAARVVVRAVPGRPRGRRAGAAGAPQRGRSRGLRRGDDCHLGDFEEYAALRRAICRPRGRRCRARARRTAAPRRQRRWRSCSRRRHQGARRPARGSRGRARSRHVGGRRRPAADRADVRASGASDCRLVDFPTPVESLHRLRIPKSFNARNPAQRRDLASTLRNARVEDSPADNARRAGRGRRRPTTPSSPGCGRRCARTRATAARSARTTRAGRSASGGCVATPTRSQRRVSKRTNTIARTFDRITALLDELGYLEGDAVTPEGDRLAALYTELDLVAAECLRDGVWADLSPAELAACVSALVYESRQPDEGISPRLPSGPCATASPRWCGCGPT